MFETIGIVDFRERPCQLEASTDQQLIGIVTERGDLRIEVGDSDVFTTRLESSLWHAILVFFKLNENRCLRHR